MFIPNFLSKFRKVKKPVAEDLEYHMSDEEEIVQRRVKFPRFHPSRKKFIPSHWSLPVMYRSMHGSNHDETYTANEKCRLSAAMYLAVEYSNRAVNACLYDGGSQFSLNEVNIQIKTWFGIPTDEMFLKIQDGLTKMHDVITSSREFLIFIDSRSLLTKKYGEGNVTGEILRNEFIPGMNSPSYDMSTYSLSGWRVYVNEDLIGVTNSPVEMAQVIYKDMTIQVLGTDTHTSSFSFVNNVSTCMALAKENNNEALKNAACWSNFVFGFSPLEKESHIYRPEIF